jgi:catalase
VPVTDNTNILTAGARGPALLQDMCLIEFNEEITQAFSRASGKPATTFGNVKADVIADKNPQFHRGNFCCVIRHSRWAN